MTESIEQVRALLIDGISILSDEGRDYGEICTELHAAIRQVYHDINNGGKPVAQCDRICSLAHELSSAVRKR